MAFPCLNGTCSICHSLHWKKLRLPSVCENSHQCCKRGQQGLQMASSSHIWGTLAILRTSQPEKVTGRSHWVLSGQALRSSEWRLCGFLSSKRHASFQHFVSIATQKRSSGVVLDQHWAGDRFVVHKAVCIATPFRKEYVRIYVTNNWKASWSYFLLACNSYLFYGVKSNVFL